MCRSVFLAAPWRQTVLGVASILVLSACGSTVQWAGTVNDGDGRMIKNDGLGLPEPPKSETGRERPTVVPGTGTKSGSTRESTQVITDGHQTGGDSQPGLRGPQDVASSGSGSGRGYTHKEIFVGYATFKALESTGSALGLEGADVGDQEAVAKAIINDINSRGGVAGRKLVPVFYDIKFEEADRNPDAAAQKACARWTEDRPVFAAINQIIAIPDKTLITCLAKRQTPLVHVGPVLRPQSIFSRFTPYLYAPTFPSLERLMHPWMQRAAAHGYFMGWNATTGGPSSGDVKIGILSDRSRYGPDFTRVVRQEMDRQRRLVAATFEWSGGLSNASNEMNQAVLRFRNAGVTHVIASNGALFFFSTAAASQNYWPRYTVSTDNQPTILQRNSPREPRNSLTGAMGVGWNPTLDVDSARDPGDVSAAQTRCRKIMRQAGQNTSMRDAFALHVRACDGFNLLVTAIKKGGLSATGIQRGVEAMGSILSASTFRVSFPHGRPDGAGAVRDLAYHNNCECFAYLNRTNHGM